MAYLIKNAQAVFSPTAADATDIRIRDGKITELGRDLALAADETLIDARGCVAWPGLWIRKLFRWIRYIINYSQQRKN